MNLPEFLLARIAEEEQRLDLPEFMDEHGARGPGWGNRGHCPACDAYQFSGTESVTEEAWWEHAETVHRRTRVLAECEAKRRIVEDHAVYAQDMAEAPSDFAAGRLFMARLALAQLALPYADHPDYDEAWRP